MSERFNLKGVRDERSKWVRLGLNDMEVQVKHSGPSDQERFRQRLVKDGIMKESRGTISINSGREDDFFRAYAKQFITGWRNVEIDGDTNPEYSQAQMGEVLGASGVAFAAVREAIEDESDFFSGNGSDSSA